MVLVDLERQDILLESYLFIFNTKQVIFFQACFVANTQDTQTLVDLT